MSAKMIRLIIVGLFLTTPLISRSQTDEFSVLLEEDREGILVIFHNRSYIKIIDYYDFPYIRQVHTSSNVGPLDAHIRANVRYNSNSFLFDDANKIQIEDQSSVDYHDQPTQQFLNIAHRRIVLLSRSFLSKNENIAIAFRKGDVFHSGYFDKIADNPAMLSIADSNSYFFCSVLREISRMEQNGLKNRQIIGSSTLAAMTQQGLSCNSNLELVINEISTNNESADTPANTDFDVFKTALNSQEAQHTRMEKIETFDLSESKKQLLMEYYYNIYDDEFIARAVYDGFIEANMLEKLKAGRDPSTLGLQQLSGSIISSLAQEGLTRLEPGKIREFIQLSLKGLNRLSPEECVTALFGSGDRVEKESILYKELSETDLESMLSLAFEASVASAKGEGTPYSVTSAQALTAERLWGSAFEELLSDYPDLQSLNAVYDDSENASDKATCDASLMTFQSVIDVKGRPGDWVAVWLMNQN